MRQDQNQVVYVNGDVPQLPLQLGQLLVDSSLVSPGNTNLQQCTSQDPLVYEPVSGGGGGSGTVTQVDTGAGLTGGPITTTGTVELDGATIASLALADTAVQPAALTPLTSADLVTFTDASATYTNSRVLTASTGIVLSTSVSGQISIRATGVPAGSSSALATEILADSPVAYYKCDEASGSLTNYGSFGASGNLAPNGTPTYQLAPLIPGETTGYVLIESGEGFSVTSGLGLSYPLTGSWTVEGIVQLIDDGTAVIFGISGNGETEALNTQAYVYLNTNDFNTLWESGAGTNREVGGPRINGPTTFHLVATKDATGSLVNFYVNGRLSYRALMPTNATGGTGTMVTAIGASAISTQNTTSNIGHVAFYTTALSAARILAHAQAAGYAP